ncbi:MAG: 8-oxo-dGTP diphosphatase MutT [Bdellovibrionales bacterium]|nr:8-oxo-dGTP diphosphatase MutT [Bdellovibrionales bacterium]
MTSPRECPNLEFMTQKKPTWIPVVTGIIKKGNLVLVGQRPTGHTLAGQWEFPGGKVELGEQPKDALVRELREELGIEATIGDLKLTWTHSYPEVGILLIFFEVQFWKGEPKPVHHTELKWVTLEELEVLDIPEANRKLLPAIRKIFTS